MHILKIQTLVEKYLFLLEHKAAKFGISVDPSVIILIEDLRSIQKTLETLTEEQDQKAVLYELNNANIDISSIEFEE